MTVTKNEYTGDGSTQIFSITFPYIEFSDVKVFVDSVLQSIETDYVFSNATQISFLTAPPVDSKVLLERVTSSDDIKITFFPGSAIRARDLNDNFTQTLYVIQEADIEADSATEAALEAVRVANEAKADASEALSSATEALADAEDAQTAANSALAGVTTAVNAANQASSDAATAEAAATQASIDAAAAQQAAQDAADAVSDGPVVSVNGKQGLVVLTTSDIANDSGYITVNEVPVNNIDLTILPSLPSV